jgi:hypothetical protein
MVSNLGAFLKNMINWLVFMTRTPTLYSLLLNEVYLKLKRQFAKAKTNTVTSIIAIVTLHQNMRKVI